MRHYWREVLCGSFAAITAFAIFYLTTAFALGYGTKTLGIARETFLLYQLFAILFLALGIGISGVLSDRYSSRVVLISGALLTLVIAQFLAPLLSGSPAQIMVFLSGALFAMGLVYGPLGSWLPSLFPPLVRYSGASVAFNMAGVLGGGLAPILAQALADRYGLGAVGYYLSGCAAASLIGLLSLRAKA
jgi:MFS family permease